MITTLNRRQCALEAAIGTLHAAARIHLEKPEGAPTATRLSQLAEEAEALRDAEVDAFLERRAQKRAAAAGAVA